MNEQHPKPEIMRFAIPIDTVDLVATDLELCLEATADGGIAPVLLVYCPSTGCYKIQLNGELFARLSISLDALDKMTEHERNRAVLELQLGRGRRDG